MIGRVVALVLLVALTVHCATSVGLDGASLGTVNYTLSPIEPKWDYSALKEAHTLIPTEPKVVAPACQFPLAPVSVPAGESVNISSPSFFLPQLCGWQFTTVAGSTFKLQCQTFNLSGPDSFYVLAYQNLQTSTYAYTGQSFPSIVTLNAQTVGVVFLHTQQSSLGSFSCNITASGTDGTTTSVPPTNTCRCGIVNRTSRIMGGVNTQVNEYPWQVGILFSTFRLLFCGGSLISNRYIVTSAYCMQGQTLSSFRLLLGGHTKDSPSATEKIVNPIRIITHPLYQFGNIFNYDIAIIEIAPLDFNNATLVARPVCLPNSDDTYAGVTATVTGWGSLYSGGPQPNILQKVDLTVVSNAYCTSVFGSYITSSMICAGTSAGGKDSCQGDSGSPMIAPDGANNELIGVVSFGAGCGQPNIPGVYSRVRAVQSWIESVIIGSTTCGR